MITSCIQELLNDKSNILGINNNPLCSQQQRIHQYKSDHTSATNKTQS